MHDKREKKKKSLLTLLMIMMISGNLKQTCYKGQVQHTYQYNYVIIIAFHSNNDKI